MPRAPRSTGKTRHDPLLVQLDEDETEAKYGRISAPGRRKKSRKSRDGDEPDTDAILDPKTSRRIFELAKDQQDELEGSDDDEDDMQDESQNLQPRTPVAFDEDDDAGFDDAEDVGDVEEIFEIDEGDMQTLDALLPPSSGERKTLADLIFAKLDSGETEEGGVVRFKTTAQQDPDHPDPALGLDPRVVEAYNKMGIFLSKYKSGPLPKPFKIIPSLPAWARLLALTHPENWTPHACRAATRIFVSSMKPAQAQLFFQVVLLDAIREDIRENKKLNPQYYEALKRAMFKPAAFFKGLLFPMCEQGCTLKEAAIMASVLSRVKIPVLHAAAALQKIAEMDYTGPNSLFIRVLLDKKFQLPYQVVDAMVFHFIRLSNTYKSRGRGDADRLTADQKDALLDVIRVNPHAQISPEVRREIVNSVERGAPRPEGDGDVEMA